MFQITFRSGGLDNTWKEAWNWFVADMHHTVRWLREWGFSIELHFTEDQLHLCCRSYPAGLKQNEAKQIWNNVLSSALSDFIVDKLEDRLLVYLLRHTYGYRQSAEIKKLFLYCEQALNEKDEPYDDPEDWFDEDKVDQRKQLIYEQVLHYLNDATQFNLQGFYLFRLKAYRQKLNEAIIYAIDEYVLDQEYEQFIQLLRHFVDTQAPKCTLLHVVDVPERGFYVFDESGTMLGLEELLKKWDEWENTVTNQDELLISALIHYLPKRLILHTSHLEQVLVRTLKNIFGYRLILCTSCEHCLNWKLTPDASHVFPKVKQ